MVLNNKKLKNFKLVYLSDDFYKNQAQYIKEILFKPTRPYCLLLVKVKGLIFALPLRSKLPEIEGIGLPTIHNPNEEGRFKGIDFSKAILITDENRDVKNNTVQLRDRSEWFFIQSNDAKIQREFKKYVEEYITCMKNNRPLTLKYKYTTLQNYHIELKIQKNAA